MKRTRRSDTAEKVAHVWCSVWVEEKNTHDRLNFKSTLFSRFFQKVPNRSDDDAGNSF